MKTLTKEDLQTIKGGTDPGEAQREDPGADIDYVG
ncbi:MAG: bacteriocin [Bacteroidota bacterium]